MVKLNKIYTKTGDDGTTGLTGGARIAKYDVRMDAIGDVDAANSHIGLLRAQLSQRNDIDAMCARIQQDLFDLGADLSTKDDTKALRITPTQVARLEQEIDALNAHLPALTSFVLPGGSLAAAQAHVARTVVRNAERRAYELASREPVNNEALKYLNRLSDLLFVIARVLNENGAADVLWKPGVNQ